ncbi:MAG: alpha/beta hydrolase [Pseudomonadota bacterium]
MAHLEIGPNDRLHFNETKPSRAGAATFVFVNALTGNANAWEAAVAPRLREQGYGALSFDFRGQGRSGFETGRELTPQLMLEDLKGLLAERAPERAILVGLSLGGLLAARATLEGAPAHGLALLNTLREMGPQLEWIGEAMPRILNAGGAGLYLDALLPMLVNPDFLAKAPQGALSGQYRGLAPEEGHASLARNAHLADWDLPYEAVATPTLVISGLQDRVFLDRDAVNRLFKRLPDAQAEAWADAGHLLPQERPERLARSLARFAEELERRAAAA